MDTDSNNDASLYADPARVAGHLDALRALILALAECVPKQQFLACAQAHLDALQANLAASPRISGDTRIAVVREHLRWLERTA